MTVLLRAAMDTVPEDKRTAEEASPPLLGARSGGVLFTGGHGTSRFGSGGSSGGGGSGGGGLGFPPPGGAGNPDGQAQLEVEDAADAEQAGKSSMQDEEMAVEQSEGSEERSARHRRMFEVRPSPHWVFDATFPVHLSS